MNAKKLDEAVEALRTLSGETQEALAHELLGRVADFSESQLSDVQEAEVARRMAKPRVYVSDDEVHALFKKYSPSL